MHKPLIIIADPDADRSESIAATFNGSYACIRVKDANEALAEAKDRRPAAVVLDFPFPVSEGRCLSVALREDADTAGIPIVAYSGWNFTKTRAKAEKLGCSTFIAHEDGPEAVVEAVNELVRGHHHAVA
ncbi:MAG: response regulator [Longimicrobiales bacterium]